jgi:hypothetical protein
MFDHNLVLTWATILAFGAFAGCAGGPQHAALPPVKVNDIPLSPTGVTAVGDVIVDPVGGMRIC